MDGMGDPLTPGWASVADAERLGFDDPDLVKRFPAVPSMPVSSETAEEIMRTLEGGRVPEEWKGSLKSFVKGIGPGPTKLNFTYKVCYVCFWTTYVFFCFVMVRSWVVLLFGKWVSEICCIMVSGYVFVVLFVSHHRLFCMPYVAIVNQFARFGRFRIIDTVILSDCLLGVVKRQMMIQVKL